MTNHPSSTVRRRVVRALALTPAVFALTAAPALAAPPTSWVEEEPVSPLGFLLVLVLLPAALFAVISLLAWLGSSGKGGSGYQPGLAWRHEPEWFGGPRDGLDKAGQPPALQGADAGDGTDPKGGASGRW